MNALPTPLVVAGYGAVSSAGWTAAEMVSAVTEGRDIPSTELTRTVGQRSWTCLAKKVPPAPAGLLPPHPRLRRASPISRFMLGAAMEALSGQPPADPTRLGIIVVVTNACVAYTNRFFNEVIDTPTLASPMLFPETVFNAPASHLAACLGASGAVTTLVGESHLVCEAMLQAQRWFASGLVDKCLLVTAEEADWLSAEAMTYFDKRYVASEGAAAVLLKPNGPGPQLSHLTGPVTFHSRPQRRAALAEVARMTPATDVLVDRRIGIKKWDQDETEAWAGKAPVIYSPLKTLGESAGAAAGLQLIHAIALAKAGQVVTVSLPGAYSSAWACCVIP